MPDTKTLLLLFAGCHLAAMSSVITNPIMYGILNGNFKQVDSLISKIYNYVSMNIFLGYPVHLLRT